MRTLITSLLIAAMLVTPLRAWTSQMQCGCDVPSIKTSLDAESDACCPLTPQQVQDESDRKPPPCDDQECPSDCCDMTIGSAFVPPLMPEVVTSSFELLDHPAQPQTLCSSPHLMRLKRPPRSV